MPKRAIHEIRVALTRAGRPDLAQAVARAARTHAGGEQMSESPEAELRYILTRSTIDHLANLQPGRTLTPTTREHLEVQVKDLVNTLQRLSPEAQAKAKSLIGNAKGFLKTAAQFTAARDRIDKAALQLAAEIKKTNQQAQRNLRLIDHGDGRIGLRGAGRP